MVALERENLEAKEQIASLEDENKRLLDTLIRHSKNKANAESRPTSSNFTNNSKIPLNL